MKLALFADLDGRPVYVNADLVTHLTKLSENQTVIHFERGDVRVQTDIETVAETLYPRSGPTA